MSFASFYNRLEKKYIFFGEGPFSALTSWLGEAILKMDAPSVKKQSSAANDTSAVSNESKIGAKMEDGTIYLGYFNKKDWFVAGEDIAVAGDDEDGLQLAKTNYVSPLMKFNKAAECAKNLKAHGHDDWVLPPDNHNRNEPDILNEMFKAKSLGAFKGTYVEKPFGYYCSSTPHPTDPEVVCIQNFSGGRHSWGGKIHPVRVRCVRAVQRP